jgi:hypothetical protein
LAGASDRKGWGGSGTGLGIEVEVVPVVKEATAEVEAGKSDYRGG